MASFPVGIFSGDRQSETISTNKQMRTAAEFRDIIIKSSGGNFIRLSDVAEVEDSVRNSRSIAWFNKQPAVLIQITKQGDANVIDTVERAVDRGTAEQLCGILGLDGAAVGLEPLAHLRIGIRQGPHRRVKGRVDPVRGILNELRVRGEAFAQRVAVGGAQRHALVRAQDQLGQRCQRARALGGLPGLEAFLCLLGLLGRLVGAGALVRGQTDHPGSGFGVDRILSPNVHV